MRQAPILRPSEPQVECLRIRSKLCLSSFTCGDRNIDKHARNTAHRLDETGRARILAAYERKSEQCCGFVSLAFSRQLSPKLLEQQDRDLWASGAPVVHIDYLAVHTPMQKQGLGTILLIEALKSAHAVAKHVPVYGVSLNSLNDQTTRFYKKMGFKVAPNETSNPLMILPIWSINELLD